MCLDSVSASQMEASSVLSLKGQWGHLGVWQMLNLTTLLHPLLLPCLWGVVVGTPIHHLALLLCLYKGGG